MENLASPLRCVICLKSALESGKAIPAALNEFLSEAPFDSFMQSLKSWWLRKEFGSAERGDGAHNFQTRLQNTLIDIIEAGLDGLPILERLEVLEKEMIDASKDEVEQHLRKLPMLCLIPLLLLQFPAFLLLLFGPLLTATIEALNG